MNSRWSIFTCIALAAGTTGFLAGFLTTLTPAPQSGNPDWLPVPAPGPPVFVQDTDGEESPDSSGGSNNPLVFFPETVLADAEALAPDGPPSSLPTAAEPGILPAPSSAATPLSPVPTRRNGLEELIDSEFSGLSDQQREIWLDVLSGLPLEDAANILRIWKQFGHLPDIDDLPGWSAAHPGNSAAPPLNVPSEPERSPREQPAHAAIRQMRELLILNLLNAESHGYRRYEPLLSDSAADVDSVVLSIHETTILEEALPHPAGVSFDGFRIDQRQGTIQSTGNSLDVAISGAGFFVVRVDEDALYTRCGRFRLDEERRLILDQSQMTAVLQPELVVPPEADGIRIGPDGVVLALQNREELSQIGQLKLAVFRDPGRLLPAGSILFQATADSGPAQLWQPHSVAAGSLQQGAIETSNVDLEAELLRLERLDRLTRVLR